MCMRFLLSHFGVYTFMSLPGAYAVHITDGARRGIQMLLKTGAQHDMN